MPLLVANLPFGQYAQTISKLRQSQLDFPPPIHRTKTTILYHIISYHVTFPITIEVVFLIVFLHALQHHAELSQNKLAPNALIRSLNEIGGIKS